MSTYFSVFPFNKNVPSFRELIELSENKLNVFLENNDVKYKAEIDVVLINEDNPKKRIEFPNSSLIWEDDFYAWFYVKNLDGGIDAYYDKNDQEDIDDLINILKDEINFEKHKDKLIESLRNRFEWGFRRGGCHPSIIYAMQGFLASALAELTDGYIHSLDASHSYIDYPAISNEFDSTFFNLEHIKNICSPNREEEIKWYKERLEDLKTNYK